MSKIICDVCGTSYPETAVQCPICGCVRPGEVKVIAGDTTVQPEEKPTSNYTHVKGGRFSKANVRKRNSTRGVDTEQEVLNNAKEETAEPQEPEKNGKNKTDLGLTIAVIALLLAIVAVVAYIVIRFFVPAITDNGDKNGATNPETSTTVFVDDTSTEETEDTTAPTEETTVPEEETTAPEDVTTVPEDETTTPEEETTIPEDETTAPEEETTAPEETYPDVTYKVDIGYYYDPKVGADVTLNMSKPESRSFTLKLKDEYGNVYDVEWVDENGLCEIDGNTITAVKEGKTTVYTIVNGEKYTCIVRIY